MYLHVAFQRYNFYYMNCCCTVQTGYDACLTRWFHLTIQTKPFKQYLHVLWYD